MANLPGCSDFQDFPAFEKMGVDGAGVLVIEDKYVLIPA